MMSMVSMARKIPKHVFTVEGNIGVGKTTTLNGLKARFEGDPRVRFVDEDVAAWEEHGLLKGLYNDTLHKSAFQACALMPQIVKLHQALQDPTVELVIMERSPWSNYHVFAKANLDTIHLRAYEYTFEGMMELLAPYDLHVHMIFLDVSPEVAIERRRARGRESEEYVLSNYVRTLDILHHHLLKSLKFADLFKRKADLHRLQRDCDMLALGEKVEKVDQPLEGASSSKTMTLEWPLSKRCMTTMTLEGASSTKTTIIPPGSADEIIQKIGDLIRDVLYMSPTLQLKPIVATDVCELPAGNAPKSNSHFLERHTCAVVCAVCAVVCGVCMNKNRLCIKVA